VSEPEAKPSRPWRVLATYAAAVVGSFVAASVAIEILGSAYPDVPWTALVRTLPGVLAVSLGTSSGLMLTLLLIVRLDPVRLRLLPGWETGPTLAVMAIGLLALGQALESATALLGLGDRGSLELVRQVLEQARGPDLFAAVLVFGLGAGVAEEIFFRGYMQARLREYWSAPAAVLASGTAFAILHVDVSGVHMVLALALAVYLGFVAELSGSTLPAIVCHVVNNVVWTLQTALGFGVLSRDVNVIAVVVGVAVFVVCVLWLRRAMPRPTPA
jgi:membrane protease YdiL (CAAX protease family)